MNRTWLLLLLFAWSCKDTDECLQLQRLLKERQNILARAKSMAEMAPKVTQQAAAAEKRAKTLLQEQGLDLAEAQIQSQLEARAAQAGAQVERGIRPMPLPATAEDTKKGQKPTVDVTMWTFTFSEPDASKAVARALTIAETPPMLQFNTLLRDPKGRWRLELLRPQIDQVAPNVAPHPMPERAALSAVPSSFGFCGAGELRAQITQLDTELDALKIEAEQLTVALPLSATWEGLARRIQFATKTELENRRLVVAFLEASRKAKVPFKAVGAEGEMVLVELPGGPKQRLEFEKNLPPEILESVRLTENQAPGVVRLFAVNRVQQERRKHQEQGPFPKPEAPDHPH